MTNKSKTLQSSTNVLSKTFRVVITQDEEGVFIAEIPSIRHCMADGATIEEAMSNINEVLEGMLEIMVEENLPIPDDSRLIEYSIIKPVYQNFSSDKLVTA